LKFAGVVELGFNVFLAGKKLAFKTFSFSTRLTLYGNALSFSIIISACAAAEDLASDYLNVNCETE
jgi:hypothetical protein